MQKKLLAVAVLSAFSGLAAAQSANVTLYGTLIGDWQMASATGADSSTTAGTNSSVRSAASLTTNPTNNTSRSRTNPAGSNFGLRGTEDLGNGLSAWFQLELSATLGAPSGTPEGANHGNAASYRNSAVGLRSNTWGSLSVGMWDTPFNVMQGANNINGRFLNATTGTGANMLGATVLGNGAWSGQNEFATCTPGTGTAVAGSACLNAGMNFDRRQKFITQWWSPNWNGFESRVAYSGVQFADNATTSNVGAASAFSAPNMRPAIWDISLAYTNGALNVSYAYERQKDLLAYALYTAQNGASAAGGIPGLGLIGGGNGTGAWTTGSSTAALATAAVGTYNASGSAGTGHRLGARYKFTGIGPGSIGVGAMWESLKYDLSYSLIGGPAAAGNVALLSQLKKTAYRLQGNYEWGSHLIGLDYTRANRLQGSISNTTAAGTGAWDSSGTGSRAWVLGYSYMLSKRTSLMGYYMNVRNESNSNTGGSTFAPIGTGAGATVQYYGASIRHAF